MFFLFTFLNVFLLVMGLAILGGAVYLFVLTKNANAFNIVFLVLGLIFSALSLCSCRLRKSGWGLNGYLAILAVLFLVQLITTVMLLVKKDEVIAWAVEHNSSSKDSIDEVRERMKSNVDLTTYILVGALVLVFCALILGCWYRRSQRRATDYYEDQLLSEQRYQDTMKRIEEGRTKNTEKRNYYYNKYPEMKEKYGI